MTALETLAMLAGCNTVQEYLQMQAEYEQYLERQLAALLTQPLEGEPK